MDLGFRFGRGYMHRKKKFLVQNIESKFLMAEGVVRENEKNLRTYKRNPLNFIGKYSVLT